MVVKVISGMNMNIMPTTYKRWGDILQKYSEHVIEEVKQNYEKFKVVVDLGSGLGNNSELLFKSLNIEKLFGIDIDQNMVEYANSQKSSENIQFLTEDMSVEWDELRPEIRELEGKVELILSSFVLHFIGNKENTAANLYRLLAPGAVFYGVVMCLNDYFDTQNNNIDAIPMRIPTAQEQMNLWAEAFKSAGFKIEKAKLFRLVAPITMELYKSTFASIVSLSYETFMSEPIAEKRKHLVAKVKEAMIETVVKYPGDMNGTEMVRCECENFTIKIIKQ